MLEQKANAKVGLGSIATVYVPVTDFLKSKRWYENVLGLEWGGHCFKLDSGPTLFLVETKGHVKPKLNFISKDDYEMFVITFQTINIEQFNGFHERLKGSGVEVEEVENRGLCGSNFKFYDPDGNKFDVWNGEYQHEVDPQWRDPGE
ncbi:VOC family protein [Paenibacillus eucommiae]|uniref:Catechol 2,3-dioxygenase-like lactoylglutathione lyase family enzyme n=1 Tax=Paenibacillus eucommiae TaxID=1355755 RepID=A0ABS4IZH9_9BACL|nr:VOC family protein [Paenibacillus eucommiae]MBP1992246.1 catechol 2,3-dioxygenase-like lactoylglutathione lyase family enzyme [Paenibacillus eucommiae]